MLKRLSVKYLIGIIIVLLLAFYFANNNSYVRIIQEKTTLTVLDMHLNNNVQYIYAFLDALGDTGREAYRLFLLKIDFIFPVVYSSSFFFMLLFIKQRIRSEKVWNIVLFIPFICGLSDWIENIFILRILNEYPNVLYSASKALNIAVLLKAISGLFIFFIFVYLIIYFLIDKKNLHKF